MPKFISDIVQNHPLLKELIKFGIVGLFCTCIDYTIYILGLKVLPYQGAVVIGYAISFIINYFLTALWTFHAKPNRRNFVGMASCHMINLFVIRIGLITLFVEIMLIDKNVAYIPVIIISSFASFVMMKYVFKHFSPDSQYG